MSEIVFFGTEEHSLITLKALHEAQFHIAAVITKPDAPKGRGGKLSEPAVKTYAHQHNIPVWQPNNLKDILPAIQTLKSPVGVLVSYGKIIPQAVIDLFNPGIINLHPSLLPQYRGPSPIEAAMINLDSHTGISLIKLDAQMDAGPIYHQESILLSGDESRDELYCKLFNLGSQRLVELLPRIVSGDIHLKPQQESIATYCKLLSKQDAPLDPQSLSAKQAAARVRAYFGFPRSTMMFDGLRLIITKAHPDVTPKTALDQCYHDGQFLIIDELIAPSGKKMTAEAFLRGHKHQ